MTPLVLVIGFLGSGKTTLLKGLAPSLRAKGLRPWFVINDYQNAAVDTEQLRALGLEAAGISGDCVCCGSREELVEALAAFEHGEGRVAIVEANGTTDSEHLIELLALEPRLASFANPIQVSTLDAKRWQKRFWHNALEREQVRTATHLWVSRQDEVPEKRLAEVRESLQKLRISAPWVDADAFANELCAVAHELSDAPPRILANNSAHHHLHQESHTHEHHHDHAHADPAGEHHGHDHHGHDHHHDAETHHFASVELPLPEVASREAFSAMLRELPEEVLRAKGLVRFADAPKEFFVFQKVDRFDEPQFFPVGANPRIDRPLALFIGPRIERATLEAGLARCSA